MARSEAHAQHNGLLEVTVIDCWIPLVSAAYCMRVARRRERRCFSPGGDGSQLTQRVRPAPVALVLLSALRAAACGGILTKSSASRLAVPRRLHDAAVPESATRRDRDPIQGQG
jgi:hypothetical protein